MTEMVHLHDGDGKHVGNICVPSRFFYRVVVHEFGAKNWIPLDGKHRTIAGAFHHLGEVLEAQRNWRRYNRAGIWACEYGQSYYEPHQVYEVTVR